MRIGMTGKSGNEKGRDGRGDIEAPTMIVPSGTRIETDEHGQLSIRTPGNLVLQNSGSYGELESLGGSVRIDAGVEVEAVSVRCADTCYIQGTLTAWKVAARCIQLDDGARAHIVLQDTENLEIGRDARLVGNFPSEKDLVLLFSRFARQFKSLPFYFEREEPRKVVTQEPSLELPALVEVLVEKSEPVELAPKEDLSEDPEEKTVSDNGDGELPDALYFGLVMLERSAGRSNYGSTSKRVLEELIKLLRARDLEALRHTHRTLFARIVEPGEDVRRAEELVEGFFETA